MTVRSPCHDDKPARATLPERLRMMVEMFALMDDRQDRVQTLIGLADQYERAPLEVAAPPYSESARVPNCESEVFAFAAPLDTGALRYHFAVENPQGVSAMALARIIDETLSGEEPPLVLSVPPDVVHSIFGRELSMGKTAGLMGMIQMVQSLTRRHHAVAAHPGGLP